MAAAMQTVTAAAAAHMRERVRVHLWVHACTCSSCANECVCVFVQTLPALTICAICTRAHVNVRTSRSALLTRSMSSSMNDAAAERSAPTHNGMSPPESSDSAMALPTTSCTSEPTMASWTQGQGRQQAPVGKCSCGQVPRALCYSTWEGDEASDVQQHVRQHAMPARPAYMHHASSMGSCTCALLCAFSCLSSEQWSSVTGHTKTRPV